MTVHPQHEDIAGEAFYRRTITIQAFRRTDGQWDIEGHLTDVRSHPIELATGVLPAGEPVHSMWLRLTVDRTASIVAARARTDAGPYRGTCEAIEPAYAALVGLRVGAGYRARLRERFAGVAGCSHLTELASALGPAVVQALAGELPVADDERPFSLDGCHALDTRGPLVARIHPRWHRPDPDGAS